MAGNGLYKGVREIKTRSCLVVLTLSLILISSLGLASTPKAEAAVVGHFTEVEGRVDLMKGGNLPANEVKVQDPVEVGDVVRTKSLSRAQVKFVDATVLTISPESRVGVEEYMYDGSKGQRKASLEVFRGLVHTLVTKIIKVEQPDFLIKTHTGILGIRGSDIYTQPHPTSTHYYMNSGEATVKNRWSEVKGEVHLGPRQFTVVGQGLTPTTPMHFDVEDIAHLKSRLAPQSGGKGGAGGSSSGGTSSGSGKGEGGKGSGQQSSQEGKSSSGTTSSGETGGGGQSSATSGTGLTTSTAISVENLSPTSTTPASFGSVDPGSQGSSGPSGSTNPTPPAPTDPGTQNLGGTTTGTGIYIPPDTTPTPPYSPPPPPPPPQSPAVTGSVISPTFNILIQWGALARDLDLHLSGPLNGSTFHVYYANRGSTMSSPYAYLNWDNTGYSGTEIITVTRFNQPSAGNLDNLYKIFIFNFGDQRTTSTNLSNQSGVTLQLFQGGTVQGTTVVGGTALFPQPLTPPQSQPGNTWVAAQIDPATGLVSTLNYINSSGDPEKTPSELSAQSMSSASVEGGSTGNTAAAGTATTSQVSTPTAAASTNNRVLSTDDRLSRPSRSYSYLLQRGAAVGLAAGSTAGGGPTMTPQVNTVIPSTISRNVGLLSNGTVSRLSGLSAHLMSRGPVTRLMARNIPGSGATVAPRDHILRHPGALALSR